VQHERISFPLNVFGVWRWRKIKDRAQKTRCQELSPAAGGLETHFSSGYADRTPVESGCAGKIRLKPAAWRVKIALTTKRTTPCA
jgi:hypothetical protein